MNNIYLEYKTYRKRLKNWPRSSVLCCLFLLLFSLAGNSQTWQKKIPELREIWKTFQVPDGGFVVMGRIGEDNIWEGGGNDNIALAKLDIDGNLLWLQEYDFEDQDIGYDMIQTSDGGFLIAGHTNSFFDFSSNILLIKTDANGNKLWQTSYGNNTSERPTGLIETADGGYAFTGCYDCYNTWQTLLCKVDVNGNLLFHKNFPGPAEGRELIETPSGFVIVGWKDKMLGDSTDINIIKTYPDGNLEWEQTLAGNPYYDIAQSIQATSDTTFVFVGGIDLAGNNTGNVALFKMHVNGQMIWENTFSGDYGDYAESLVVDEEGNIIIGGHSWNNPGQNGDFVIIKADSEGQELWTQYFGDTITQFARDIILTQSGGYAICGATKLLNPANQYILYGEAFLVTFDEQGYAPEGYIDGYIYHDLNESCILDDDETPLQGWHVRAKSETNVFYGVTDENGYYNIELNTGNYTLEVILNNGYWLPCTEEYTANIGNADSLSFDFPLQTLIACAYLEVDISAPSLVPCQNQNYTVEYCNYGPTEATDAYVEVVLDPGFTIVSTELPFSVIGTDSLSFELGNIPVGQCESFEIGINLSCNVLEGATHCVSAHIFPDSICLPLDPLWDGSSIEVTGECDGDFIEYRISNLGDGDMMASQDFIIIEDHIIYRIGGFQLESGEQMVVPQMANGKFSRIEVEQSPFHPGMNFPNASVEACGDSGEPSLGYFTQYPQNDGDPFVSIDCQINMIPQGTVTKHAQPVGYTEENLIQQGQEIEYHVHFENNVTDSVFRVVVRDTLSPFLDWSTVQPGASSHPYIFDITSNGIITFTFDEILLLNNNINPDQSSGYIKFKVQQLPSLPPGTQIWNTANAYFNYDIAPFQSNEIFHTINPPFRTGHAIQTICVGECFLDSCYQEPTATMFLDTTAISNSDSVDITFYMLEVLPTFSSSDSVVLHAWEEFLEKPIENDTIIQETFSTINGCDSTVSYNISVIPLYEDIVADTSVCPGTEIYGIPCYQDTVINIDTTIILPETYAPISQTPSDTIRQINVRVHPVKYTTVDTTISPLTLLCGAYFTADASVLCTLSTMYNCDSIVTYNIDVVITSTENLPPLTELTVYPNPSMTDFTITYQLNQEQKLHIELYDILGRKLNTVMEPEYCAPGLYQHTIDGAFLSPGVYHLLIHSGGKAITRRIVKVRD